MTGIGLLNEKPLHASLKEWYAQPGDRFEVPVDGYVIDLVRGDLLVEIQTANLGSIRPKLESLARSHRVRLVYPQVQEKRIVKLAKNRKAETTRRKSPRRGRVEDLFWEMVSLPQLLTNPNFSLELLMIKAEEVWRYDGKSRWRRRGWVVEERRLLEVVERRLYEDPSDWRAFLPADLDTFTSKDVAEASGITQALAQKMLYCLRGVSVIKLVGKQGRANLYSVARV